jgi:hypothetical protein
VTSSRRRAQVSVGRGSFSLRPGQTVTVNARLTSKGKRLLSRLHALRVLVVATTRTADGKTAVTSRTLRLAG